MKLLELLQSPLLSSELTLDEWSLVISESRYQNMAATLYYLLKQSPLHIPTQPWQALKTSAYDYLNQLEMLQQECAKLSALFTGTDIELIYLKGAAYQLLDLPLFSGRVMADIDILVRKNHLDAVESTLKSHGWRSMKITDYDDMFYRQYSQEIPPLRNMESKIELDIHFNVLPVTLKNSPVSADLFRYIIPLGRERNAYTLTPAALTMHSAIHLMHEGELHKGLRDLFDLHLLCLAYQSDSFWDELIACGSHWKNGDSLFLALRYCQKYFNSPIPDRVMSHYAQFAPNAGYLLLLDYCYAQVIENNFPRHQRWHHWLAKLVLYIRGHLKRMPLRLLLPHLLTKAFSNLQQRLSKEKPAPLV